MFRKDVTTGNIESKWSKITHVIRIVCLRLAKNWKEHTFLGKKLLQLTKSKSSEELMIFFLGYSQKKCIFLLLGRVTHMLRKFFLSDFTRYKLHYFFKHQHTTHTITNYRNDIHTHIYQEAHSLHLHGSILPLPC